jgi:hypothetical protein
VRRITVDWADRQSLPAMVDGVPITDLEPQELREVLQSRGFDEEIKAFEWPTRGLHLLDILNNANARSARREPMDPIAAGNVDRLLIAAFLSGKRQHQKRAVELAYAASPAGTQWLLGAAFTTASAMLSDVALKQARHLHKLPDNIRPRIRESLVAQWAVGAFDKTTAELTRRRLLHIDDSGELQRVLHLLRWMRPIALGILVLPSCWVYVAVSTFEYRHGGSFTSEDLAGLWLIYALFIIFPLIASVSDLWQAGKRASSCAPLSPTRCVWQVFLAPRILPRSYLAFALGLFAIAGAFGYSTSESDPTSPFLLEREPGLFVPAFYPSEVSAFR